MLFKRNLIQFSRNCARWAPAQKATSLLAQKFVSEFQTFYPNLIDSALSQTKHLEQVYVKQQIKKVTEYFPMAKFPIQGELLLHVYDLIEKPENINEKMMHQVFTLGCIIETIQANYIIQDDVLDDAKERSNMPCWHLLPHASPMGLNDNNMLRSFINEIIRQNIEEKKYAQIMDVCNEMFLKLEMAQERDIRIQATKDFSKYTMSNYNLTQIYKTSFYILVAPLRMVLILTNKASKESFQIIDDLCNDFAVILQIHNDVVDSNESLGKTSTTDIQFGKCTWPAVVILQHCNPVQRKVFEENYGRLEPECVKRIRQLYSDLNLLKLYKEEINNRCDTYLRKVNYLPKDAIPSSEVYREILDFYRSYVDDTSSNIYN